MFRLKYDDKNLDWQKATIFDFRYIWYLARMIQERSIGIGLIPGVVYPSNQHIQRNSRYIFNYLEYIDVQPKWNIKMVAFTDDLQYDNIFGHIHIL